MTSKYVLACKVLDNQGSLSSGLTYFDSNPRTMYIDDNLNFSNINSIGIGTQAPGGAGEMHSTGNITAYYSDERLKNFIGKIEHPIEKIEKLNGYYYTENELAKSLGYTNEKVQVGVSAQEVENVLPEIVTEAPIDKEYKTVWYDKMVPLLIEAIKEQQKMINTINDELAKLRSNISG
jgi:hypothetical protein